MPRWLDEMRNPAAKCERVGHKMQEQSRRGYLRDTSGHYRCVAVAVKEKRTACRRCGMEGAWERVSERGISSLTLDSEWMETLEETGEVWPGGIEA